MAKNKVKDFEQFVDTEYSDIVGTVEETVEVIPTGSHSLDILLGIGGIPRGRFTEIWGPESSGKTTLALTAMRNAIDLGIKCLYIDVENQLSSARVMQIVGEINTEMVTVVRPKRAEDSLILMEKAVASGEFGFIILDSVAALSPERELEAEFEDEHYALIPRMMTKFFRRNVYAVRTNNVAILFLNQVRANIGSYVKSFTVPGGHALEHYCSIIIALYKSKEIEMSGLDDPIGLNIKFTTKKNKMSAPSRTFYFPILFDSGIDEMSDLLSIAERLGVIERRGSYYYFEGASIGQGSVKACDTVRRDKEMLDKIKLMCYNTIKQVDTTPVAKVEEED